MVTIITVEKNCEIARILEGPNRGKVVHIPITPNKQSFLSTSEKNTGPKITISLTIEDNYLVFDGKPFLIKRDSSLRKGSYYIGFPDYPHTSKIPKSYFNESHGGSRFADTWFPVYGRIETYTGVYLHFGKKSEGCITVIKDESKWGDIYLPLISHRLNDTGVLAELNVC